MATNLLLAALGLISGTLAARLLGPVGRGELAAIQTWPLLLATLASLGVPDALVYFSAREPDRAGRWLTTAICLALAGCVPFALIGYLLLPWVLGAQSAAIVQSARVYLWMLPIQAVVGILLHPLRGRNDLFVWNLLRPTPNLFWIALLLVQLLNHMADPTLLAQQYLVGLAILGLPLGYIVTRRLPGSFRPSPAQAQPLLRFGLPGALSTLPSMLNLRLDQMLMAGLLGPQILGLYVTSVAWSNAVAPLVNAVAATLLPRVAGAAPEQQGMLLAQSTRLGLILALLLAFSMALLAPLVIPLLFGAAFAPAVPAAVILCLAAGVAAFNQVLEAAAQSLARPRYVLMAESVGLIATISLLWLLLPSLQLIGAALASIMSYTIVSIVLIGNITKQAGLTIRALLVPRQEDIAALVARLNLRGNSWLGDLARWRDASQDRDQADVNED